MNIRPALSALALLVLLAHQPSRADSPEPSASQWRDQARALLHGDGVGQDVKAAVHLYCKAALRADTAARYTLGWMYANGRHVVRDARHASYFFQLAAEQGEEAARNMLSSVGFQAAKPPCVVQVEQEQLEQVAQQEQRARELAEAAQAAAQAATQKANLDKRYQALIDNAERRKIFALVQRLAPEYGIHPGLVVALIQAESNFDPQAVSDKNAQGLMQLIPETAARFRVMQPFDPEQNIRGGLAYLRWLLAYFQGDVDLAVAAYNAGEGAVNRFGGVPPFLETQNYLRRIREVFPALTHPFDQRVTKPSPMFQNSKPRPRT